MALRSPLRHLTKLPSSLRNYSNSSALIELKINEKTGITTAALQRPPVNSLNLELLTELSQTLTDLEKNKSRGLILTSNSDTVFSAGLDILELYKPNVDRLKLWWSSFQQTWIKLYGSSYPTVAVVNGHAPAGGCLLALSCEYRIMLPNFTIGLNETQLGITPPTWLIASMRNTVGFRQTEMAVTEGKLFKTDEALKIGLVDEVVATKEEGLARADKFLQKFARISPQARSITKGLLRKADIKDLERKLDKEIQDIVDFIGQPHIQKGLGLYLESLKQKNKQ